MNTAELLNKWASKTPDALAIVSIGNPLNFAKLRALVSQLASKLTESGITSKDLVAIKLSQGLDYPITLALMVLGVPNMTAVRGLDLVPGDFGVSFLISSEANSSFQPEKNIVVDKAWWQSVESSEITELPNTVDESKPIRYCFTGGSSGELKTCPFSLAEINLRIARGGDDFYWERVYSLIGLPGWLGFYVTYRSLANGTAAYLFDSESKQFLDLLIGHKIQEIVGSPAQLMGLSRRLGSAAVRLWSLEKLNATGGALSENHYNALREAFKCEIFSHFGATESARVAHSDRTLQHHSAALTVLPDTKVEVVDDQGEALPAGSIGNLRIQSDYLASIYVHKDQTSKNVKPDGWFYPGDKAVIDAEGHLTISHRDSEVTTVGGVRVNLAVVENILVSKGLADECKAFVFEIPAGSQEVLAIAIQSKDLPSDTAISELVWSVLPEKVSVLIHPMSELPRNDSGKIGQSQLALIQQELTTRLS